MTAASTKVLTNEFNSRQNWLGLAWLGLAWLGLAWRSARALEVYPFLETNIDLIQSTKN